MKYSFDGFLTLYVTPLVDQTFLTEKEHREGVTAAIPGFKDYQETDKVELVKTHDKLIEKFSITRFSINLKPF